MISSSLQARSPFGGYRKVDAREARERRRESGWGGGRNRKSFSQARYPLVPDGYLK